MSKFLDDASVELSEKLNRVKLDYYKKMTQLATTQFVGKTADFTYRPVPGERMQKVYDAEILSVECVSGTGDYDYHIRFVVKFKNPDTGKGGGTVVSWYELE
jgi:hypothetical protein